MKEFNRTNLTQLYNDINAALAAVASKHGLNSIAITPGTLKFSSSSCHMRVDASIDRRNDAQWMNLQATYATRIGLPPNVIGQQINYQGKIYEINSIKLSSRLRPVICTEVATGRSFKFMTVTVKRGLEYNGA